MDNNGWPDSYCPKTKGDEHSTYYTAHDGIDVCRCGAKRDVGLPEATTAERRPWMGHRQDIEFWFAPDTQKARLLETLLVAPICSYDFYENPNSPITHRVAARVGEMRKMGFEISSVPCPVETHRHKTPAVEYALVSFPS